MCMSILMRTCLDDYALVRQAIHRGGFAERLIKCKGEWGRRICGAITMSAIACSFAYRKLFSGLLTVANTIVRTEGNLPAVRQEDFLTTLHQVLLIKCPGVHEVLQHDHEDVLGKGAHIKAIGQATGST